MARSRAPKVELVIENRSYAFTSGALKGFPEAGAFLAHLLAKGTIQPHVATYYVQLAARLKRQGRIHDPETISHRTEATAANVYRRWLSDSYTTRLQPLRRALGRDLPLPNALTWIRRHALVPPFEGKKVPRKGLAPGAVWQPITLWDPCDKWTLHVPEQASEPHTDPCETCGVIPLDETLLGVISEAFKNAWGHTDLNAVPPDALLFGTPPVEGGPEIGEAKIESTVALSPATPVSNALSNVRSRVARDVDAFLGKLAEGAEGVYLSREACGDRLSEVLTAVWNAWQPKT